FKNFPERITDRGRFKKAGGYLVQQRGEVVIIILVNQRYIIVFIVKQMLSKVETCESSTNQHDMFCVCAFVFHFFLFRLNNSAFSNNVSNTLTSRKLKFPPTGCAGTQEIRLLP